MKRNINIRTLICLTSLLLVFSLIAQEEQIFRWMEGDEVHEAKVAPSLIKEVGAKQKFVEGQTVMTLPGGLYIYFKEDMDDKDVQKWAFEKKVTLKQKVLPSQNAWLIESPAGEQTLHMAQSFQNDPSIKKTIPVWLRSNYQLK